MFPCCVHCSFFVSIAVVLIGLVMFHRTQRTWVDIL